MLSLQQMILFRSRPLGRQPDSEMLAQIDEILGDSVIYAPPGSAG
jgi:hypothetical protein